ncbi:MAG: bifunctional hydroxymethylpyrimidine kinase/phosphomethylpyrimidine kinase [Sphingomonadaceae bacterium]|uniref:bifunctional hydroxymethylpyrimidine kinase/phosphomethylpyrimidine kinase n=1 Tax=Thermaurantiacus sp. TaxID=2820283 RepID=UPI00298EDEB2|nr:bifunctional hydroxymethylpyrimidine kinase/phosphomethylpyrimidine kinase [Thermaurantiacus sp.]MCS6987856.1 bifunctional hydroxymethylpyrimidine kinase/phosphomethylpyrimidine kinase [Sphingomonadaceae bacterium]MDW8414924.1 bifunctional hydroxymethylpyrimidine kinase/phosphomethylpyrimidine kinase [Thermaurantiacus sp.]
MTLPRVLAIGGSDSGGGAGIQADVKTILASGGFAATAVTAVTAQDTIGVEAVHAVPPDVVAAQIRLVLADLGADAVKTGMLGDAAIVGAVADALAGFTGPLVVDPVMVAKGGAPLLAPEAVPVLCDRLIARATVVTPNVPELEALLDLTIADEADLLLAAQELLTLGPQAVLAKGGHLEGAEVADWLVTRDGQRRFASPRIASRHTHGTGCTLASALATSLAAGRPLEEAVVEARAFVAQAIHHAPGLGRGHGPLGHGWPLASTRT